MSSDLLYFLPSPTAFLLPRATSRFLLLFPAAPCNLLLLLLQVNVTNSYDKQEINPEMLELAKFAKHHIPEEHELDDQVRLLVLLQPLVLVTSPCAGLRRQEDQYPGRAGGHHGPGGLGQDRECEHEGAHC